MLKRISYILLIALCMTALFACGKSNNSNKNKKEVNQSKNVLSGKYKIKIEIIDYGTIEAELDADSAPITVTNFINLVNEKFYDGLTIHRVIKNFVIQGGDPNGDGTGGSRKTIKGEFIDNGVNNQLSHTRGALSMARAQDYDSASSQFFICHKDALSLNGQYAVFGYVTSGIEVVDAICEKVSTNDPNGMVEAENQPVIKSITVEK